MQDDVVTLVDSLKFLAVALVTLAAQWVYSHAIPWLRAAVRKRNGSMSIAPPQTAAAAPPPRVAGGEAAADNALILERLRQQAMADEIERARSSNLEAYLREIRILCDKIDGLADSRSLGLAEIGKLAGRLRRITEDLEKLRTGFSDLLKRE